MKAYVQIIDEKSKACIVGKGADTVYYRSIGMTEQEVEQAYDGQWYLKGYAQQASIEYQNEQIRLQRQARFAVEFDPLKLDYDEAVARGEETAEEKKQAWLDKKTQIREELPYIV